MNLFENFETQNAAVWKSLIEKELKGKKTFDQLFFETNEGITLAPFYGGKEGPPPAPIEKKTPGWRMREDFAPNISNFREIQNIFWQAYEVGVRYFLIDVDEPPVPVPENWRESVDFKENDALEPVKETFIAQSGSVAAGWLERQSGFAPFIEIDAIFIDPFCRALSYRHELGFESALKELKSLLKIWTETNFFAVDLRPYYENGADVTLTCATSICALRWYYENVPEFAAGRPIPHLVLPIEKNYFVEIAKLRALRRILSADFSFEDVVLHAQTPAWNKTEVEPHNNLLRTTTEAAAAVIGGCSTLGIRPYNFLTERCAPTGHRLARNIQLLLQNESYFGIIDDPAAGSYFLEHLTDALETRIREEITMIMKQGGLLEAMKNGWYYQRLGEAQTRKLDALAAGRDILLGVNKYSSSPRKFTAPETNAETLRAENYFVNE